MADRFLLDELKKRELTIICQFPRLKFHTPYFSFQALNSLLRIQRVHDPNYFHANSPPPDISHTVTSLVKYANTYTPTLCLFREGHKCAAINAGHRDERYDNGLFINVTGIAPFPIVRYYDFGNILYVYRIVLLLHVKLHLSTQSRIEFLEVSRLMQKGRLIGYRYSLSFV